TKVALRAQPRCLRAGVNTTWPSRGTSERPGHPRGWLGGAGVGLGGCFMRRCPMASRIGRKQSTTPLDDETLNVVRGWLAETTVPGLSVAGVLAEPVDLPRPSRP